MRSEDLLGQWSNGALYVGAQSDWWLCFRPDGLATLSYVTAISDENTAFTWSLSQGVLRTRRLPEDSSAPWHWQNVTPAVTIEDLPVAGPKPVLRFPVIPRAPGAGPDVYAHVALHIPGAIDTYLNRFASNKTGN